MSIRLISLLLFPLALMPGSMENQLKRTGQDPKSDIVDNGFDRFCSNAFLLLGDTVSKPSYTIFSKAVTGFLDLKATDQLSKNLLTVVDFSISSNLERMWIIDLNKMRIIHRSLVAHGHNSGEEFARIFSNSLSSHMSSLGFYITGSIYNGIHGMSLILEGVEQGINDNAREREIVIHGADYVSSDFIRQYGRLGRSFGCPSIPQEDHEKIIEMLAGGSCLFIYYPDETYLNTSKLCELSAAVQGMYKLMNESHTISSLFAPRRNIPTPADAGTENR